MAWPILSPPLSEQGFIVNYLDREITQIDTLIAKQQQLAEALLMRRVVLAEQVVTNLTWSTPLRSAVTLIQTGPFGSQLSAEEYVNDGIPVINPSHLVGGRIIADAQVTVAPEKADNLKRHKLTIGDLIMARRGELGRCAVVDAAAAGYLCGTGSAIIRPIKRQLHPAFLMLVLSSRKTRDVLSMLSVGSTMDNLNASILAGLKVPTPSLDTQKQIVMYFDQKSKKIDILLDKTEQLITLSRERRAALITAAVTGQIDVREMA